MASDGNELKCPSCGEKIFKSDQQCLNCGTRLDAGRLAGADAPAPEVVLSANAAQAGGAETAWPTGGAPAAATAGGAAGVSYDIGRAASKGWDPGKLASGGGLMASITRGWVFLKQAVGMAFKDKDLLLPSIFSLLANVVLLGILIGALHLTGHLEPILQNEGSEVGPMGWAVLIGFSFVGYVVTYFFTGMTVHLVDVHLRGQDAKLGTAFADSLRNIGGILMLAVVTTVVALITSALRGNSRYGARRIAADAADRAWQVATYLLLPIIILEDIPFIDATGRATRLHGSNVVQIVVGELGLLITTRIFTGLMTAIAIGIAVGMYFLAPAMMIVGFGIAAAILLLTMTFAAYVRTAFYTCMYLWAAAIETVGETAPAPAPLQPAVQRAW